MISALDAQGEGIVGIQCVSDEPFVHEIWAIVQPITNLLRSTMRSAETPLRRPIRAPPVLYSSDQFDWTTCVFALIFYPF